MDTQRFSQSIVLYLWWLRAVSKAELTETYIDFKSQLFYVGVH